MRDLLQTCANGDLKARTSAVSKLFVEWNVLPHAKTTLSQYSCIVAGLLHFDDVYNTIAELMRSPLDEDKSSKRKLSMKHIALPCVWEGSESSHSLKFRLHALFAFFASRSAKDRAVSGEFVAGYITAADGMYTFLAQKFMEWNKDTKTVFAMAMTTDYASVEDYAAHQCRSWKPNRSEAWLNTQRNALRYIMMNTTGLENVATSIARPKRAAAATRSTSMVHGVQVSAPAKKGKKRRRSRRISRPSPRRKVARAADVSDSESDIEAGTASASQRARPWRKTKSPRSGMTRQRVIVPPSDTENDESNEAAAVAKHTEKDATVSPTADNSGKDGGGDDSGEDGSADDSGEDGGADDSGASDGSAEDSGDDDGADDAGASDGGADDSHGNNPDADSNADGARVTSDGSAAEEHEESNAEDDATHLLPFMFDGGPPGQFSVDIALPPETLIKRKATPSEFVEMKIAEPADIDRIAHYKSTPARQVPDIYSDGFRVRETVGSVTKYMAPAIRCGYHATICLLDKVSQRLWMLEKRGNGTGNWYELFDDNMPTLFPFASKNVDELKRAPFNWARRSSQDPYPRLQYREDWEKLASGMPIVEGGVSRKRAVLDMFMWLRTLGLRPPHRAFFCLDVDDLEKAHEDTYLHAHFRLNRNHYLSPTEGYAQGRVEGWFRAQRATMDEAGFCILDGFIDDSVLDDEDVTKMRFHSGSVSGDSPSLIDLFKEFERLVPGPAFFPQARDRYGTAVVDDC